MGEAEGDGESENGDVELPVGEREDGVADEREGRGGGRRGANKGAECEGGEGEGAGESGGPEFGPELGGSAVQLEDVLGATVDAESVTWIRERGGTGAPAEPRAVLTHAGGGGEHGRALDVAEIGRGGGVGGGEHRARARVGDGERERDEGQGEEQDDFFSAWERRDEERDESEGGEGGHGGTAATAD